MSLLQKFVLIGEAIPLRVAVFLVAVAALGIFAFYKFVLLPKPLPGIPYNTDAAKKIFGDLPSLRSDPDGLAEWSSKQLGKLRSPICQALMGPDFLAKPIVLVADVGQARDALLSTSDYDRSSYIIDRFPLFGDFHLNMKTNDDWKLARHWSKDLLTPQYMNKVSLPAIEASAKRLVDLWEHKSRLANGRPFDISRDVKGFSIDIILEYYFGKDAPDAILDREVEQVRKLQGAELADGEHTSIVFPEARLHDFCEGLIDLSDKITGLYTTAFPPALAAWWTRWVSPRFRKCFDFRDSFIGKLVSKAVQRTEMSDDNVKSGLDHMVWRESKAAAKSSRAPIHSKQAMIDETYGALIAGQHTTSAAVVWILKLLSDYPDVQAKLREECLNACSAAARESRPPTAGEIVASLRQLPYLKAVVEEMLRMRQAMLVPRDATQDTELLGCRIPKGTVLLLVCQGPDPSTLRSVNGKPVSAPRMYPGKNARDASVFDPERWLVRRATGEVEFDGTTYPQLAFGGGVRACWGRKLAELEMHVATALLVCRFDLLGVPTPLATHEATYDISYRANKAFLSIRSRDF